MFVLAIQLLWTYVWTKSTISNFSKTTTNVHRDTIFSLLPLTKHAINHTDLTVEVPLHVPPPQFLCSNIIGDMIHKIQLVHARKINVHQSPHRYTPMLASCKNSNLIEHVCLIV